MPVVVMMSAMFSKCFTVIRCSMFSTLRVTMSNVSTIAKPEKMAPATK